MSEMQQQHHEIADTGRRETVIAWVVIGVLVASMFFRAWISWALYGDPPRGWQYRTSPYIPAQAYSSTRPAPRGTNVEKQVPLPPGAGKRMSK